jgi:hypothetical protein
MNEEMKAMLTKLAERRCGCDNEDFCVEDYAGGNLDDAYSSGQDAGETMLARALLKMFFEE